MDDYKPDFFSLLAFMFRDATWWSILIGCVMLLGTWVMVFSLSRPNLSPEASTALFAIAVGGTAFSGVAMTQPTMFLLAAATVATLGVFIFIASLIARKFGAL